MKPETILAPSTQRFFPRQPLPEQPLRRIEAALNERFSFQVLLRSEVAQQVEVSATGPKGWQVRVRRVGYVPVAHHNTPVMADPRDMDGLGEIPGFVPDPLFDESNLLLPQFETHAFWISVQPAAKAVAGNHAIEVAVAPQDESAKWCQRHKLTVKLHDVVIPPREGFDITHWFYNDQIIDWYQTNLFDERYWELVARYITNVVEHGQNVLYVPTFTPPLDGVKSPSQLLGVKRTGPDRYRFNWRDVRRYVRLARELGITHFEWCHPFTQWGVRHAIRIYEDQGATEQLLWPPDTGATSETYRRFLEQFLPAFKRFLDSEGIRENSYFHVSDEPHGAEILANYKAARDMLRELAPWMECMDALSEISYARAGVVDLPVPSIATALQFVEEGIESWCYYCCGPREGYLQHLMDTPLAKVAMHGLLFYRWPFRGFLHWGYNYWCQRQRRNLIDPFTTSDGKGWPGWAYGDTFLVYPGPEGPIDSIRWEIFGESMQDYALLQAAGVARDDRLLAELCSFKEFPKEAAWRLELKKKLYARIARRQRAAKAAGGKRRLKAAKA